MSDEARLRDYLARLTGTLRQTRQQLEQARADAHEPIAVVAMACRYPGSAESPEALWELLDSGRDAIGDPPTDRGWGQPAPGSVRRGGFLHDAGLFDADLFRINPREALAMNPQQRLVLEASWEALERASIDPRRARGTQTGVFIGALTDPYGANSPSDTVDGYRMTGSAGSVVSGRVSYTLGLQGPAITVDTACSSSLVAVHLACHSLRQRECDLALAGGVAVMSTDAPFMEVTRLGGLAADGRCKAFGATADGMSMAEGVGVLVLERLSQARRNGHPVLAVIRGSAVNQDGASSTLTAPNGPSQRRVIRQALANAQVEPSTVDAVEAHGTGTQHGDPIEANALLETYGQGRPTDRPLWLGSIKSNIGHSAAAAGAAGVIKMVLALQHEKLPRTLHADTATPHVDWSSGSVALLTDARPWPRNGTPRRAGVSSFGLSGTNAHLILEEAPAEEVAPEAPAAPLPWVISAHSEPALTAQAERLRAHVERRPDLSTTGIASALLTSRSRLEHSAVVTAADRAGYIDALERLARGETGPDIVRGRLRSPARVVFAFPGNGSQWTGMAVRLLDTAPAFAEHIARCEEALREYVPWSLTEVLRGVPGAPKPDRIEVIQPVLFAVMTSLAALWRSCGVEPDAVVGHSQGEIAAAYTAGALDLAAAIRIVALRGQLLADLGSDGGMASISLPVAEVEALLAPFAGRVSVAAVNGPRAVVVSGPADEIDRLCAGLEADGTWFRRMPAETAGHSPAVEKLREPLTEVLADLRPVTGKVPFYSTVTGGRIDTDRLTADYWCDNMRETVRLDATTRALLDDGHDIFVELGAHPVLAVPLAQTAEDHGRDVLLAGSLRRDDGGLDRFLANVAQLSAAGVPVDWEPFAAGTADLPTYAFQRQRFWLTDSATAGDVEAAGLSTVGHPMLAAVLHSANADRLTFTGVLSPQVHAWLDDHRIGGRVVLPASTFVELAVRVGDDVGASRLTELTVAEPLVLPDDGARQLQVTAGPPDASGHRDLEVFSRSVDSPDSPWIKHASGRLAPDDTGPALNAGAWPPADAVPVDPQELWAALAAAGLDYGPAFRGVRSAWRRDDEYFADVALPAAQEADAGRYRLHPALLESALQVTWAAGPPTHADGALTAAAWNGVSLHAAGPSAVRVRARHVADGFTMELTGVGGERIASVDRVAFAPFETGTALEPVAPAADSLFRIAWTPFAAPEPAGEPQRVVVLGPEPIGFTDAESLPDLAALRERLDAGGTAPDLVVAPFIASATADTAEVSGAGVREATGQALELLQAWHSDERLGGTRLVLLTRQAIAAGPDEDVTDLANAAVIGLVRTAQSESPDRFVLVDTDASANPATVLLAAATGEPQHAIRDGSLLVPRLSRVTSTVDDPGAADADGTVLITGGLGTLGRLVAEHYVRVRGARRLVLTGRRGAATEGAEELRQELAALGADVTLAACDVADADQVRDLLAAIPAEHPLTVVVHAAAALDDGILESMTPERVDRTMRPKVDGLLHLHALTEGADPAEFVVFSAAAGIFGNPGQANYAAANAFADALVAHRRANGRPGTSLAWGLWAETSDAAGRLNAGVAERIRRGGVLPMSTREGLALLDRAMALDEALLVPVRVDLPALRAQSAASSVSFLWHGLVRPAARRVALHRSAEQHALVRRIAAMPAAEADRALLRLVTTTIAAAMGRTDESFVERNRALKDIGFDSLTAVELRNRLNAATGLRLPTTLVFDHPTPSKLATHLRELLLGLRVEVTTSAPRTAASSTEPIAIIGIGCRFPGGVKTPEELWDLLMAETDALSPYPADRGWRLDPMTEDSAGVPYLREGGFLYDAADFDPGFFGISPREAVSMDPQQRLLLETCWEAVERAGIDPTTLRGSQTGVFIGASPQEFSSALMAMPEEHFGHFVTGTSSSVVSGRVSYVFGLEGPAVTVDTACSSSLVALHLAATALRQGECSMALSGGTAVMSGPGGFIELGRQDALARDGRCKAFSSRADGSGMAEGVGTLLLERLSDAQRNGHTVLAVIRASAINQDGASNGLTAPSGPAQQKVIRQALGAARLASPQVDMVEAHGTGTALGDPIEAGALLTTYGQERRADRPLWLGSVKSNIGHTQAAAGAAGVIKVVLAMQHGVLPRTLHVEDGPTPHVDWASGAVSVLSDTIPWPETGEPRRAAVSAFGISGTNVHLILEQAPSAPAQEPADEPPPSRDDAPAPVLVSGRSQEALRAQAAALLELLDERPDVPLADVAFSLLSTRTAWEHRAVVLAGDRAGTREGLAALAAGEPSPRLVQGLAAGTGEDSGVVFVFPGQGSQWAGMGRQLLDAEPVFAEQLARCDAALAEFVDWSLLDVVRGADGAPSLDRVDVVQPVLFGIMVSLAELWRSYGVTPAAVAGHSQGEVAAACVAGALSLRDGARIVALRSRRLLAMAGRGGMLSIVLPEADVRALLTRFEGRLSIAAVNGPAATVVSGDADALVELERELSRRGAMRWRVAGVDFSAHSAQVDALAEDIRDDVAPVTAHDAPIAFYSSVTGTRLATTELGGEYWYRNLRSTVRFDETVRSLADAGHRIFLEVSPHPLLIMGITDSLEAVGREAVVADTLTRDGIDAERFLTALAELHVNGVAVDWRPRFARTAARRIDLPTYRFQRRRYWPPMPDEQEAASPAALGLTPTEHPVLGAAVELPETGGRLFTATLTPGRYPWLAGRTVSGTPAAAGALLAELAVAAGDRVGCSRIDELVADAPLALPGGVVLQTEIGVAGPDGRRPFSIRSRAGRGPWLRHASGVLAPEHDAPPGGPVWAWPPADASEVDAEALYAGSAAAGLAHDPAARGLREVWQTADAVYAEVALDDDRRAEAERFGIHPVLLDAALSAAGAALDGTAAPRRWSGVSLWATGATVLRVRIAPLDGMAVTVALADEAGEPVATVERLECVPLDPAQPSTVHTTDSGVTNGALFELSWKPVEAGRPVGALRCAIVGADHFGLDRELGTLREPVEHYSDLRALGKAIGAGAAAPDVVLVSLPQAGDADPAAEAHRLTLQALAAAKAWLDLPSCERSKLVYVTRGAMATDLGADVPSPAAAAPWGFGRSAQWEDPDRFALVDLDPGADEADGALLRSVLAAGEAQTALRDGRTLVPRLVRATPPVAEGHAELDPHGTVLIVGNAAGLGGVVARHLAAAHSIRHLILASRTGPKADGATELQAELATLGAQCDVVACDAADAGEVCALVGSVPTAHPLTAVVHAAGTRADDLVESLTPRLVDRVLRAKVDVAAALHEATAGLDLAAFVLFSSAVATFGAPAHGSTAAANAFVEALAATRRAQGLPATALGWGPWRPVRPGATGGAPPSGGGIVPLPVRDGLALFDAALRGPGGTVLALRLHLAAPADGAEPPPLLSELVTTSGRRVVTRDRHLGARLSARLAGADERTRETVLLEFVRTHAAAVLGHPGPEAVDVRLGFLELGFDSIMAVRFRNALNRATGLRLPTTVVYDESTPRNLVARLSAELSSTRPATDGEPAPAVDTSADPHGLTGLFRQAFATGDSNRIDGVLRAVSQLRPSFGLADAADYAPAPVRLASGQGRPMIVCFPATAITAGPQQYARFSTAFRGQRDVVAVPNPGYLGDERVPESLDAFVEMHLAALRRYAPDAPVVLLGHSAGGLLAHWVAVGLERAGRPLAGLVLVDVSDPREGLGDLGHALMAELLEREQRMGGDMVSATRLTAMGAYNRLLEDWRPIDLTAPTLLLRATHALPAVAGAPADEQPTLLPGVWRLRHEAVDVPGDHFTMMEQFAEPTAQAVEAWIERSAG
jgi:acyl transferase domain-containing protein/surfactin synthase thioesterase subunit/acyl carrier protein